MKRYSILTVDLNNEVTSEQREAFYKELEKRLWKKINTLTTLWYTLWQDGVTDEGVIATTQSDVEAAAKAGKVQHYDASAVCGKPVVWTK